MKNENPVYSQVEKNEVKEDDPKKLTSTSRRKFLGEVGGITAVTVAAGVVGIEPILGSERTVVEANEIGPVSPHARTVLARNIRKAAADNEKALGVFPHPCNGTEPFLLIRWAATF